MRQIVFDLETTGLRFDDGHRIVEIGGVEMVRGAVTGRTFHAYVNPMRGVPDEAFRVHGLSTAFLSAYPAFADRRIAGQFLDFVGEAELIAHNGSEFDLPFLNAELAAAGLPPVVNSIVDTLIVARRRFPGAPVSLDALCARFSIDRTERARNGHGALLDSRLLAQIYVELTGGAQAGLDFARIDEATFIALSPNAGVRPHPLPSLLTAAEAALHAAFVESELGAASLWRRRIAALSIG